MRHVEVRGVLRRTGEGAFVEEIPLSRREGDVGVERADAVGSGFVVVVAGEVGDFGESTAFAQGGVVCEDGGVVDGWVESCLGEGEGGEGWDVAGGGEESCERFGAEAGEGVFVCGVGATEGAGNVIVDGA